MLLSLFLIFQLHYNFNAADYPDAAGLIVEDYVEVNVDKDFRQRQHKRFRVYIFNTRGRERYADHFEKYNKKEQDLKLIKTQTILENGKIVRPEEKAISDLSTVQGFLAPVYKHYRTRSISYSDVNAGVMLEYESEKVDKHKSEDRYISGIVVFQKQDPILHKEYRLRVPKEVQLKQKSFGAVRFEKVEDGNFVNYRWWVDSTGRLKDEPSVFPLEEFAPRIVFTNFKDWDEVGRWLRKRFDKAVVISGEMKRKVASLKDRERLAIISDIYNDVTKNWRDIPLSVEDVGYTPNRADVVYKNRYGNQIDKCALLISLLKDAGIEAFPAYISFSEANGRLPLPNYFKSVLVAVPYGDKFIYLDPRFPEKVGRFLSLHGILYKANSDFPLMPDVVGRYAFIVKPDTVLFTRIPGYGSDIAALNITINLQPDGSIAGTIDSRLSGFSAITARARLRHKKEKEQKIALERLLGQLRTGVQLKGYQIKGLDDPKADVEISLQFECVDYLIKQGKRMRFNIPPPLFSFINIGRLFSLEEREYPFTVGPAYGINYSFIINIPETFKVVYLPSEISVENSYALAKAAYTSEDGMVKIEKRFVFKKADFQPDEFRALQEIYNKYRSIEQQLIIFE